MISTTAHPLLADLITLPAAHDAYRRMGCDDVRFTSGYIISKPPHSPPLFWHFDWMGWSEPVSYEARPLQTFFMVYLVDTTRANGCLRVIPGSHLNDHPLHQQMADAHTPAVARAEDLSRPEFQTQPDEVDVPVRAGDLVIGDSRLLHAAHANTTGQRRTVITLWMHPNFGTLPESIQAFCARFNDLPKDWPPEAAAKLAPLLPTYDGDAKPATFSRTRHPRP
jgi:ectoine hydroxylase-related dioxygenase (phytanoyl-CoA dioxygenase family)